MIWISLDECHKWISVRAMLVNDIHEKYEFDYSGQPTSSNSRPYGFWSFPYPEPVYTGWSSVHWNATGMPLVDPVYTGIPLDHPANTCRYTGTPLEKLSWNSPHWNATGETLTFAAYTGTPLEGLWQPTQAPTHIVKHAEWHPCQFEMTRWRDISKQVDRSLYIQPLLGVYCSAMDTNSALNTCEYFNITLRMSLMWASL